MSVVCRDCEHRGAGWSGGWRPRTVGLLLDRLIQLDDADRAGAAGVLQRALACRVNVPTPKSLSLAMTSVLARRATVRPSILKGHSPLARVERRHDLPLRQHA